MVALTNAYSICVWERYTTLMKPLGIIPGIAR
jgi:hypothetical protein